MSSPTIESLIPEVRSRAEVAARLIPLSLGPRPRTDGFSAVGLGDIDIFRCRVGPSIGRIARTSAQDTCILVGHVADTTIEVTSPNSRRARVEPGHSFALRLASPYQLQYLGRGELTGVLAPLSQLSGVPDFIQSATHRVLLDGTLAAPTWAFLSALLSQPFPWQPITAYFAESLTVELLLSMLLSGTSRATPHIDPARSMLRRARNHIIAFARDPRISSSTVADSLGVSVRSLQRLFSDAGLSLSTEIRRSRVDAAIALLRAPEAELMSLEEVAQASGYLDAVAMRRAFHAFGVGQPRTYRASGREQQRDMKASVTQVRAMPHR